MEPILLNEDQLDIAAKLLQEGKVVVFPTETVFGIGAIYDKEESFRALVNAKHRSPDKPFTLMCHSLQEAFNHCELSAKQQILMKHFLPGELTVLVRGNNLLPQWVTLGTGILGIRVPDSSFVCALLAKVGKPCLVTSANISGEPTVASAQEAIDVFGESIACAIEGETRSGKASTIIDLTQGDLRLIRQGGLSFDTIMKYWRNI